MSTQLDNSCKVRIAAELEGLNKSLTDLMDNPNHDDYFDDPALSIDVYKVIKVCLSYGGPSSYLEVSTYEGEIRSVEYRFSDWFDTATVSVPEGTPAYIYAVSVVESLGE